LKDKDEVSYFNIIINFGRNIQISEIKIENGKRELKAFKVVGSLYEYELLK
jgi:predicted DNA-binding transcriptional regulator